MTSPGELRRLTVLLVAVGLLAGCAQPPGATSAPPAPRPSAPAPAGGPQAAPGGAPAPEVSAPPPLAPLAPQQVPKTVASAIEMLEAGHEEQAAVELQRVLQTEPGHKLAQSLLRQIRDDPVAMLGRESFSYRVQPGESLSRIAQRFLNDVHLFYVLARYNDIKVPRQLGGGQLIRVPGKAPPPSALTPAPAPAPVPAPARPTVASPAPAPAPAAASATDANTDAEKAARARSEAITRHTRAARAAFAKQDLNGAIRAWDAVLELDANNRTAQLERQKAIDLKEKLTKVK